MDWNGFHEKVLYGGVAGVIAWLSWLTRRVANSPARHETIDMIRTHSPYVADQVDIHTQLAMLQRSMEKFDTHLDGHIANLHALHRELERIRTILDERNPRDK